MSEITLTFTEYQEIRDAMAHARGNLKCYAEGNKPMYPQGEQKLQAAYEILEYARWRTEDRPGPIKDYRPGMAPSDLVG